MLAYIHNIMIQLQGVFKRNQGVRVYYRIRQVVPQRGKKRIHILIGTSNWTNKIEIMHVSRLKRWYSVNKISNRSNRQSIHIAEEGTQF